MTGYQALKTIEQSPHFSPSEFPDGAIHYMDPRYAARLAMYRAELGAPIVPSPLPAAWFRLDGSADSRHYALGRLSDAGDIFPLGCNIARAVMLAARHFGGVGVYLDTWLNGRVRRMLHTDCRPEQVLWARMDGEYIYAHREPERYFALLMEVSR